MSANAPAFDTIVPRTLTICTYVEFAPFAYEAQGEVVGTDIALLRRFAAQQGLDVRIIKKPFAGLWYTPGAGECDIAAAGIAAREDRDLGAHGVWSMPYMTVQRSLLIHASEAEVLKTPEDFAGKKIVVTLKLWMARIPAADDAEALDDADPHPYPKRCASFKTRLGPSRAAAEPAL